jgi:cytoskeletal protein RodZ
LVLFVALLLAVALAVPTAASATEKAGYGTTPPAPTKSTKSTPKPTPSSGTSPSKETSSPSKGVAPATTSTTPSTSSKSSLPFTGFDLRWSIGIGVLLLGAGLSIVSVQRRQRRGGGS